MFNGSENESMSCLKIFKHFIDLKYWLQGWGKKGDKSQGLACEGTSVPSYGKWT